MRLCGFGPIFGTDGHGLLLRSVREDASLLIGQLLGSIDHARFALAEAVVRSAEPVGFAAECFQQMRLRSSSEGEEQLFSEAELTAIGSELASRIAALEETESLASADPSACSTLYWIAARFGQSDRLRASVDGRLTSSDAALALIRCYLSQAWDGQTGMPLPPTLSEDRYAELVGLADAERLMTVLEEAFDLSEEDGGSTVHRSSWDDADLARHFASVHRSARRSSTDTALSSVGDREAEAASVEAGESA
jgi:hypothetical protein